MITIKINKKCGMMFGFNFLKIILVLTGFLSFELDKILTRNRYFSTISPVLAVTASPINQNELKTESNSDTNINDQIPSSQSQNSNYLEQAMSGYVEMKFSAIMKNEEKTEDVSCILGDSSLYVFWWLNEDFSVKTIDNSNYTFFDFSSSEHTEQELVQSISIFKNNYSYQNVTFVSMAKNSLNRVPYQALSLLNSTLQFLSLAVNQFNEIYRKNWNGAYDWATFPIMTNLLELDLRNSSIRLIKRSAFINLPNLEKLFLSHNSIEIISTSTFEGLEKLIHLDLSYNNFIKFSKISLDPYAEYFSGLAIHMKAFANLTSLAFLDLSHTKIVQSSVQSFKWLPWSLEQLSLCHTSVPIIVDGMFSNSQLKVLDLSGNDNLVSNLKYHSLNQLRDTLEILVFRNSSVKNLVYFNSLHKLRMLDLRNNHINELQLTNLQELTELEILDLSANHISTWFNRVFNNNKQLTVINLRQNNINYLTKSMIEDFSMITFMAIGRNEFVCDCGLRLFFEMAAKNAMRFHCAVMDDDSEELATSNQSHAHDFDNMDHNLTWYSSSNYNVLSRHYLKLIQYTNYSSRNLRQSSFFTHQTRLIPKSANYKTSPDIFINCEEFVDHNGDFDEEFENLFVLSDYSKADYQCLESFDNQKVYFDSVQPCKRAMPDDAAIEITTEPERVVKDHHPKNSTKSEYFMYDPIDIEKIVAIAVLVVAIIVILFLWKGKMIKYFFVLFKNSVILTFSDDSGTDEATLINMKNRRKLSKRDYVYDVFVSYSDKDRQWVLDHLLPNIEKRTEINVCLHERDFQVGLSILENIISCMDQSRCLLLVISDAFLLSHWCQFEMHLAQHRLLETRRDQLILVLLEDIPKNKRSKTLHYLMKTKTYIVWPTNEKEKKNFWKRLKKAIISSNWEEDGKPPADSKTVKLPRHSII